MKIKFNQKYINHKKNILNILWFEIINPTISYLKTFEPLHSSWIKPFHKELPISKLYIMTGKTKMRWPFELSTNQNGNLMVVAHLPSPGWRESQFYRLPFRQAVSQHALLKESLGKVSQRVKHNNQECPSCKQKITHHIQLMLAQSVEN